MIFSLMAVVVFGAARHGLAQVFTWTAGGDGVNWTDANNWSNPTFNDYPRFSTDTALIAGAGNIGSNPPILNANITIGELQMTFGGDLFTGFGSNYRLNVTGLTNLTGNEARLQVNDSPDAIDFDTGQLTINTSSGSLDNKVVLAGGTMQVNGTLTNNGEISGGGTVRLNSTTGNFVNDGTIRVDQNRTMVIEGAVGNTRLFDWDGAAGTTAVIEASDDSYLDINLSQGGDAFGGTMILHTQGQIDNEFPWTLDTSGTIEFRGTGQIPGNIRGNGAVTTRGTVDASMGTGQFLNHWTAVSGQITMGSPGVLTRLAAHDGIIMPGADVTLNLGEFTITGDFEVDQTGKTFDWDGPTSRAETVIFTGDSLIVRADAINPNSGPNTTNRFASAIDTAGALTVTGIGPFLFIEKFNASDLARVTMTGNASYDGVPIVFGATSTLRVRPPNPIFALSVNEMRAPARFDGGVIDVGTDTSLAFRQSVEFRGVSTNYVGDGGMWFLDDVLINTTAPLDLPYYTEFRATNITTLIAGASLNLNNYTAVFGGAFVGGANTTINVNGGLGAAGSGFTSATVTVFNLDGPGNSTITINPGATLDLNVTRIDTTDDIFDGTLDIRGTLDIDNAANQWTNFGAINLNGGDIRGDAINQRGVLTNVGDSTIQMPDLLLSTISTNQIDGNLTLSTTTTIQSTASFSGGGRMIVTASGEMNLQSANLATVSLTNRGQLRIDSAGGGLYGIASVNDLTQEPDGQTFIDLAGFIPGSQADRISAQTATFAGDLVLQRDAGYDPLLYTSYLAIPVVGAHAGTFDTVPGAAISALKGFAVTYEPAGVRITAAIRGDVDLDGDVDTGDLTTAIINNTGAGGSGKHWALGDSDGDGDVDSGDLTTGIINFTGASGRNANVPDLIYDPATGDVWIDADFADVISFTLGPGPFLTSNTDFSDLPPGLTDNLGSQIGWTSFNLFTGLTGTAHLGRIVPAGLDAGAFCALIATADYGLALAGGGGGGRFDIPWCIPEPTSMVLLLMGVAALSRRRSTSWRCY